MAKVGRRPHENPPVKWNINLPLPLAAEVELLLTDPITGMPRYGGRSQLIQALLHQWVQAQRKDTTAADSSAQGLTRPQETSMIPPESLEKD